MDPLGTRKKTRHRRAPRILTRMTSLGAAASLLITAAPLFAASVPDLRIDTNDVDLFFRIYDSARGHPGAAALQQEYLDEGSEAVRQFIPDRIISGEALALQIERAPAIYSDARTCSAPLATVRGRVEETFGKLIALYPQATFPPLAVLIGRNNSGGTTSTAGVIIGLEVVCRSTWLQPSVADRLVHLIAHEYVHVQQFNASPKSAAAPTVLSQSLVEGVAELIAELTSGEASAAHLQQWTKGREQEIDRQFMQDLDSQDLSRWLYNGVGTIENPGDLGYWEGYRIAKSYYERSEDKIAAINALIVLKDARRILKDSGWPDRKETHMLD